MFRQMFATFVRTKHVPVASSLRSSWPEFSQKPQASHQNTLKHTSRPLKSPVGNVGRLPESSGLILQARWIAVPKQSQRARARAALSACPWHLRAAAEPRSCLSRAPQGGLSHSSPHGSHTGSVRATPQTLVQSLSIKAETQQSRKFQIKLCRKLVYARWVEMPPVMVSHSQFLNSRLPSTQPEQSEATFPSDFLIFCMLSCAYVVVGRKFLRTCVCVCFYEAVSV